MDRLSKLLNEIKQYCEFNNIEDVENFTVKCLLDGFNISRFGSSPMDNKQREEKPVDISIAVDDVVQEEETPKKEEKKTKKTTTRKKRTIKEKTE